MKKKLTIESLKKAAKEFCKSESTYNNTDLYGVTDGKAVGTYIEHKFHTYLEERYTFGKGSSAKGIDFPDKEDIIAYLNDRNIPADEITIEKIAETS
ncbi:MAG: hypothetical protein K9G67_12725 [Bacteroidales bacterium]|nr:hypothetical protein [Bacteroidales bacterium]MCF8351423.1 hypothetical protein [Bacteroidales bacterium]MCF8377214.1 hypothetical protein [Bacteroidales bacterium]MCF8401085.1 hypothetical protein [Bacteroidales bacterium]